MKNSILLFLSALLLAGCGTGNIPISGTVTFSDDGSPLPTGTVIFDDGKSQAQGKIQPDGKYVMGFDKEANGVPPGTYAVTVIGAVEMLPNPEGRFPIPYAELIDVKHTDKATSGLTIDVNASQRIYDIQVDRAKR